MSSIDIRIGIIINPNKIRICIFCGSRNYLDWTELIRLVLGFGLIKLGNNSSDSSQYDSDKTLMFWLFEHITPEAMPAPDLAGAPIATKTITG